MNDVNKGKKANMKRLLMTMGAALGVAWTGCAEMKEMTWRIPLMEKAPVIDGTVDPAEWAGAHGSFGFVRYPTDTVAPIRSAFFVGRTKDRLYLAGLGKVGPTGLARAVKARKGNVDCFSDDTYEIVLVPDAAKGVPDIRHVIVNYNGAYRTQALLDNKMAAFLPETMVTKSAERDGWWHFEWSIALDEIGFAPEAAERHAIRFCRNFKRVENQWGFQSSMRPDERGFFAAGRAVPSAFDDAAVAVQLVTGDETDASRWNLTLRLHNPTATAATVEAKVEGRPVNSQPGVTLKTVTLQPGETVELPVSGPVLGDEKVTLVTDVKQDGKTVFFREIGWRPNGPAPQWLKAGEDGSGVKFDFAFYPSHNRMRLRADLTTIEKRPKTVRVELRNDENRGRNVLAETTLTLDADGVADVLWDIPDLKAVTQKTGVGGYTLTLVAEGVKKGTLTRAFRRDVFDWEGFTGGTSDTVPSMFEPVRREKVEKWKSGKVEGCEGETVEKVSVVLRDHFVDPQTGLWKQVLAAGKPVLARPMRLIRPSSPAADSPSLAAQTIWDVDGLMTWELTLPAGHYEPLTLEIPIRAERAKLFHPCADGMRFNYAGVVPEGTGRVWTSAEAPRTSIIGDYLPYIWIGGPLRGIAVFGESDKGWVLAEKAHCQEVFREDDGTVVLKLNLIQKPADLAEARTIRMGFMATPVKRMEKDFRAKPIGELVGSCYYWGGYSASDDIHPYDGTDAYWRKMAEARRTGKIDRDYIERAIAERVCHCPTNSPRYAETYRCFKAHFYSGMNVMANLCGREAKAVWYTNGRGVRLGNPEGATFADEWTVEPFAKRPFAWGDTKSYSLDPNRAYLDFAAYWWEKALALGCVDYFYWDDIFCQSNFDLVGTESYRTASGDIQPASGIFNQRAQVKRCAILQAEHGWTDHKNWVHMTNTALAPVLSFAGTNYDWEDVAGDTTIQERYPRACIQAQSLGRQFGNQVAVMGYFATKDPKSEKLMWLHRTGVGAVLTHELWWPRVKEWRAADARLTDWGYRQPTTRVWNYWDEDVPFPVAVTGGESAALAMRRADGEAVVVVSDWKDGGDYSIRPACAAMGIRSDFAAYDLETGKALPVADGAVKVTLARFDYVMIGIR